MRKTIRVQQLLKYVSLAALVLSGSLSVAVASGQDGAVIKGAKGSEATDVRIGQERYGPIGSSDTLWEIASRYKPHSSVTQYQTMVAIVQANQHAFVNGNMNRMLDGFYLRIPSLQEIEMVNPETARRQVVVDGQLETKAQELSTAQESTQRTRSEQQQLLEEAREKAEQTIEAVEQRQEQNFNELRSDIQQSMQAVERMYGENQTLQERIDSLAERLDKLATSASKADELEVQFQQVLAQQRKLLEQQARDEAEQQSGIVDWLQSPVNMLLVSVLPALLIIVLIAFFFLRRGSKSKEDIDEQKSERKELTEEEAAAELDKELLGDVPTDSSDGLFDIDDEESVEDEGDDLSALEAELTGDSDDTGANGFSAQLDEGDPKGRRDKLQDPASKAELDENLDEDDQAVLPDSDIDNEQPDTDDENAGELSQDELDRLFGEADDDDEQAIDLSVGDEDESAVSEQEMDSTDAIDFQADTSETETAPDVTDDEDIDDILSDNAPKKTLSAEDPAAEQEQEDRLPGEENVDLLPDDFDDSEVDDVLANLGLSEAISAEQTEADVAEVSSNTEPKLNEEIEQSPQEQGELAAGDEDDLEQLLRESDELTQSLNDLEEEVPEDDPELDQAEDEADIELESLFGDTKGAGENENADAFYASDDEDLDDEDFVDIDSLMAEADAEEEDTDRYQPSAVKDILPDGEQDSAEGAPEDDDPAAQLDLARAYIEMDEEDEAREILQQLSEGDDELLAKEAEALKQKLDS